MMKVKRPTEQEIRQTETWDTWSKEPSEFAWLYDDKETCYILEGNARVVDKHGHSIEFGPGDWVEFEQGLECTWMVTKGIRKKYRFG
ncbi:MAG: cupin domain-containing protein [Bacteroidales bacterium]|nr:cupin domain-containing protein [Bacteroidales bacterium]MBN2764357.1 cupin domain-containing protein [Bacteroidales bacterium]